MWVFRASIDSIQFTMNDECEFFQRDNKFSIELDWLENIRKVKW